jgi:hypothetical protein
MSLLDTLTSSIFTSGFNDSALGWVNYGLDTGSANNYAVTLPQAPSAYIAGMCLVMTPVNDNSAASVVNVNTIGNVPIVNRANLALIGGEIIANKTLVMIYDGTSFRIISFCGRTINLGTLSALSANVNCAGYDSVSVALSFSGASFNLGLLTLGAGIPVNVKVTNVSAGTRQLAVTATNSAGTAYTNSLIVPAGGIGTQIDMAAVGLSMNSGSTRIMTGISIFGGIIIWT